MFILILGIILWWCAHLFKQVIPERYIAVRGQSRGMVAGLLILSVLLMIWGYRIADVGTVWWGPLPMLKGINNLLVLIAFYLFAASGMKTSLAGRLRHPQLIGFSLWAFAHILVNGDLPSLVLFGGLLSWAIVEIIVINRNSPITVPEMRAAPLRKDIIAFAAGIVAYGLVGIIHSWLGYNPFGG